MRITNKIMQMNSLTNININKVNEDNLSNQMASGKKVLRPSDDPVLAIRSLRLRTTLTDITQYLEKNVEDADSWLKVTEDSINTVNDCLEDTIAQCNKGAVDHLTTENRNIILDALRSLKSEIYASGDADYAGRGVFTGYRTATKLLFQSNKEGEVRYDIKEPVTKEGIEEITYVKLNKDGGTDMKQIGDVNAGNYDEIDYPEETDIYETKIYRMRVAYDGVDDYRNSKIKLDADGKPELDANGDPVMEDDLTKYPTMTFTKDGQEYSIPVAVVSKYDENIDPYLALNDTAALTFKYINRAADGTVEIEDAADDANPPVFKADDTDDTTTAYAVLIPETGEIILNQYAKEALSSTKDDPKTKLENEGEINITYSKSNFVKGDLRPEHYFECTQYDDIYNRTILHNKGGIKDEAENQIISYDVGFNQEIRVNTIAPDIYDPAIKRDIDDLINIIEEVSKVEDTISSIEAAIEKIDPSDTTRRDKAEQVLASAKKAYTYLEDKMQKMFENGITKFNAHQAKATLALTEVGTRTAKLTLVQSRLGSQQTNFKELVANNDQVDIAEVATNLASAKLAYDAALQATAKLNQTNLLNYL